MEPFAIVTLVCTVTGTLGPLLWNRAQHRRQTLEIRKLETEIAERESAAALHAERGTVERLRLETEKAELQQRLEALRSPGRILKPSLEDIAVLARMLDSTNSVSLVRIPKSEDVKRDGPKSYEWRVGA